MSEKRRGTVGRRKEAEPPIVAIGASAGGLDPLRQLFSKVRTDTGMAFVVIQHLDPDRPSMLAKVLVREVGMKVLEVLDGVRVEANHVYVIPPGSDLTIHEGVLGLVPRSRTRKLHLPIDAFFRALAADQGGKAIGVILSGSAFDGTEGLRAIKEAGGITFAQEPQSAQFRSMPDSAIAAEVVDVRAEPEGIAAELVRLSAHSYLASPDATGSIADVRRGSKDEGASRADTPGADAPSRGDAPCNVARASIDDGSGDTDGGGDAEGAAAERRSSEGGLSKVLDAVRRHARLDFKGYKKPTLRRRISRRMALRQADSLSEYADMLDGDPAEARALAQDILIHVTSFFRDPAVYETLSKDILPELLSNKKDEGTFRLWVPGCSTGQEAYSLAICLVELLDEQQRHLTIKIFGSDLSDRAIATARAGLYSEAELEGVSPERLERFFERTEGRYRVGQRIRDLCVFVRHDLTRDPPFAKLDVISCRNVLIYFGADLQRRVLPLLHHCLATPGYLVLGSSEGIREFDELFVPADKEKRIFLKSGESRGIRYPLALGREAESKLSAFQPARRFQPGRDAQRQADHVLLARYAPPGVVVNDRFEVIQFRGRTGDFLEPPPGHPQTNVLRMARPGLVGPLKEALSTARAGSGSVRRRGVRIGEEDSTRLLDLEVIPLSGGAGTSERYFLIVFDDTQSPASVQQMAIGSPVEVASANTPGASTAPQTSRPRDDDELARLRAELAATRDYVEAISGEHQDTTEELGAANEELIAANEELQSTNEELQSAKEELQSTNEELTTLNDELHNRNQELDRVASDLVNVLESVQLPVIIVDQSLRIRRFTPSAQEISSLQPGDVGRSIDDVKLKVRVEDLVDRIRESIQLNAPRQYEIQGLDDRWFRLHIRSYRTADQRLDGAVLSFVDIDVLKHALEDAERARDYAQGIVETVPMALVVLDRRSRMVTANPPFRGVFSMPAEEEATNGLFEISGGALDVVDLREAVTRSLSERAPFKTLEIQSTFEDGAKRVLVVTGCLLKDANDEPMLLLAMEDITERRQLEASEKHSRIAAEQANRAKDLFLATLSHELRTPLGTILMSAQLLQQVSSGDATVRRASEAITRAVGNQARLIDDLLDISRIVSGKLILDLQAVDLATVVQSAVDVALPSAQAKGLTLELTLGEAVPPIHGDAGRLQQVVANLLHNAIKFTPPGGRIDVALEATGDKARLTVKDTGMGMRPELLANLFDRFVQAESAMTRSHGGLGLGLAIVRHLVNVHGGEVTVSSEGEGKGTLFTVTFPLVAGSKAALPVRPRTVTRGISGVRVLLIEDDPDTRAACAAMLESQGAEVRSESSAEAGLHAAEEFDPQAILCDIAMPGEDGYSFIRKLRAEGSEIPAAALTALAGEEDRQRALAAGFQLHLPKPIDAERLTLAVASLAELSPRR